MGTVNCILCDSELFIDEDLCLYRPVKTECHLSVKYERTVNVTNENKAIKVCPVKAADSEEEKFNLIKSATIKCCNCDAVVGFRIHCGPNHDSLLCISLKATYNLLANGTKLLNSINGGAPMRKNLLSQFLVERNVTEFYGQKMTMKSDALVGTLKHPSIEDLNSLDLCTLVKDRPRSYQIECFCAAALFSSIIQIPTGAGKTLISIMLTALYKRQNPGHMVWFLTDRVPLVFQQARYIEEQTSLTVLPLAGDVQTELKPHQLIKYDVLVCTVQLLINMLVIGQIRIEDVSLVILDEVHHAVRNHPYVVFLETFLSSQTGNNRPRVLGLTASPAAGTPIQMKLELRDLGRLCGAQLYTPCIYRDDLASSVNRPNTTFIPVNLTHGDSKLSAALFENVRELLAHEFCPTATIEDVRANLRGLSVKARQDPKLAAKLYKINQFLTALEMTSILGSRYSQPFLIDLLKDGGIDKTLTPSEEAVLEICKGEGDISPKAQALSKLLESIDLVSAPDTRMIVFVETKRTARWLASFLQKQSCNGLNFWNATAFTGQASGSIEGMAWSTEQRPILALFRSGHIKLLIATSVLQEGLDVAACNHIVLFDRTWSLKAFLQSRGRARAQDSEYTIICSSNDQNYYEKLFQQEIILSKMVRDEMVDGDVLPLELVMAVIHLNVKCRNSSFSDSKSCISIEDDESPFGAEPIDQEDDSEFILTLNVHNVQTESYDGPCDLNISGIERKRDHLHFFGNQEELFVSIELPAISIKKIRSWIPISEELLDPLLNQRYPDALIELDRILPELLGSDTPQISAVTFELQRLAVGALDSGNKFIEASSQHHSSTPSLSLLIFDPLGRKINVLFQETVEKTFRIEIPYDSIDSLCLISRSPSYMNGESNFSLTLPVKTAPLLYITTEDVSRHEIEKRLDEIYWERVTANSFSDRLNELFSLCPAIRFDLFLNGMTSRKLFSILRKIGSSILYTCNLQIESFPEFHSLWLMRVENFLKPLDFDAQYRLRAVMSETWSRTSLRISIEWLQKALTVSRSVLENFIQKLSMQRFIDPLECLIDCDNSTLKIEKPFENIHAGLLVKLVTWTPSRIILHCPTLFLSNRVLREFGADNFIRVHFRDEDLRKLSVIKNNASIDDLLENGVREALDNGISIGNRRFEFLAMSSSQLRGHGCWFVNEEIGAERIRKWLGNFDGIKNIAKYVARLGQSFSSSRPTLLVPDYIEVPDWKANGFCFSDGCGMISSELAQELAYKLNLLESPSAYQIRYAGFKGVVAVAPESKGLSLRPSMDKFPTHHRMIEVLNIADPFPCYLNRQVIMILSALGVPDSAFEDLQLKHLKFLAECFNSIGTISLKNFNVSNLDPTDPFMRSLISAQYRQQLTDLLTKTRIAVPQGRILMGVIDETGTLEADEIFCQIHDDEFSSVIDGPILIAKNPCMHPGDVRVLRAVTSTILQSYSRNVIVFSRHGARPVPNMCSGSDLDGDLYFVTWDKSLMPPNVEEAMNYDGLPETEKSGPIVVEDLKQFMVFFIQNDQLGAIANTHVAFADRLPDGVRDPACVALSQLFSLAVDFPKTGFVAKIPKEVRVENYPDFMQKYDKPTYASHRIIGKLFREIRAVMSEEISENLAGANILDKNRLVPGYENYLVDARKAYEEYAMDIGQCLTQYGFRMESHLLMNCTISVEMSIREMGSDVLEIAQLTIQHHAKRYQEYFDSLAKDIETGEKIASAWYYAAYSNPITPAGLDAPILSFPWVIKNISTRHIKSKSSPCSTDKLIAQDLKEWFLGREEVAESESTLLVDILSQKLALLHQIKSSLEDQDFKVCLREFLLTRSIIIFSNLNFDQLKFKICKAFPSAIIKSLNDSDILVTIDSNSFIFSANCLDRLIEFSSPQAYLTIYLIKKFKSYNLCDFFSSECEKEKLDETERSLKSFDDLVKIEEVPKMLRTWLDWISEADDSVYLDVSSNLLKAMERMIESESEFRVEMLRNYHSLLRSCRITSILTESTSKSLNTSIVRTIIKNPRILRQVGFNSNNPVGPTGSSIYVQGASKLIFIGSTGEADALRFGIHEGKKQIRHLSTTCYKISLSTPQLIADDAFAFNEFWAHLHRQFHYLRKFGGPEYGQLRVGVKLGEIYAIQLPRMFMEQTVNIWLARVALDKSFKSSKWGRKIKNRNNRKSVDADDDDINDENNKAIDQNETSGTFLKRDFSQFKCNPRNDECVDDVISSSRATQSLQTFLDTVMTNPTNENENNLNENFKKPSGSKTKSSKSFGNISTAFETSVDENVAMKFLKMGNFKTENNLQVSLTCYDGQSNTNSSLQLTFDEENRLKGIGQRGLRWVVVDVLSPKDKENNFNLDSRITISSVNSREENLEGTIFSDGIVEFDSNKVLKVRESFRSNPTIYARLQEGHSAVLRDDFSLIIRKITEAIGVDPTTGLFALTQEKWEIEAKMILDWEEIHDYQYRDQLILSLWSISRRLKRPYD